MESLAPTYDFCLKWRLALERGTATHAFLRAYLQDERAPQEIRVSIERLVSLGRYECQKERLAGGGQSISPERQALFELVPLALKGEPVLGRLKELEKEIFKVCQDEIDQFLAQLPLKMLIPLMLFMFPAFLILLLGPLLNQLLQGLS